MINRTRTLLTVAMKVTKKVTTVKVTFRKTHAAVPLTDSEDDSNEESKELNCFLFKFYVFSFVLTLFVSN